MELTKIAVEKQMIVPLSPNQMGWRIAAECCGSHAKHPHTITPPPPCFTVGNTHAEIIRLMVFDTSLEETFKVLEMFCIY